MHSSARPTHSFRRKFLLAAAITLGCVCTALAQSPASTPSPNTNTGTNAASDTQASLAQMLGTMVHNEVVAHDEGDRFSYTTYERSARTGGHLWTEKVVEVDNGLLRRLLDVDSQPLSPARAAEEDRRIEQLAADPAAFRRANQGRKDDEAHALKLLSILPHAFFLEAQGEQDGCERIAFRPDPAYQPKSYEERVVHAMAGTVLVHQPDLRLCRIDAHLTHPVEFAFGLLGHLSQDGGFSMQRAQVNATDWKTQSISIHFDGTLLFFKSFSRQQETVRRDIHEVPKDLTLEQAVAFTRP
jgi:hypothetical protein